MRDTTTAKHTLFLHKRVSNRRLDSNNTKITIFIEKSQISRSQTRWKTPISSKYKRDLAIFFLSFRWTLIMTESNLTVIIIFVTGHLLVNIASHRIKSYVHQSEIRNQKSLDIYISISYTIHIFEGNKQAHNTQGRREVEKNIQNVPKKNRREERRRRKWKKNQLNVYMKRI